jgi:hypothetical protein
MSTSLTKALLATFIVALVVVSSTRLLDDYTDDYTNEALKNAALTYAAARGLNAVVSLMQSSSVEAGIGVVSGSVTVGELLDPLNDMIERFSTVMTWVLASLAAQKVLLLLASHKLFLYLVAVLGVSAVLLLYFGKPPAQNLVFRSFLVVVFVRFALGVAVALNSGVDYLFLQEQFEASDREVANFQEQILDIETDSGIDPGDVHESMIAFWRSLSLEEFNRKVSEGIENFINLLAIYLIKTIAFPLLFFYMAFYVIRQLWRFDLRLFWTPEPAT